MENQQELFDRENNGVIADCLFSTLKQFLTIYEGVRSIEILTDVYNANRKKYGRSTSKYQGFYPGRKLTEKYNKAISTLSKPSNSTTTTEVETVPTPTTVEKKDGVKKPTLSLEDIKSSPEGLLITELFETGENSVAKIRKSVNEQYPLSKDVYNYDKVYEILQRLKKSK